MNQRLSYWHRSCCYLEESKMTYLFKINPLQLCLIYSLRFHVLIHLPLNQFKILVHHLLLVILPVYPIPLCSLNYSLRSTQFYLYSICLFSTGSLPLDSFYQCFPTLFPLKLFSQLAIRFY